jgi:hypothetical protein
VLYLLVVTDSPHAPTVNIDNTTATTLDDSLPGQLVNPRSRPSYGRSLEDTAAYVAERLARSR